MSAPACPACAGTRSTLVAERSGVPVNSCLLLTDEDAARSFPTGLMSLRFCPDCGFVFNAAFDPAQSTYSADYEETQAFSPRFREFMEDLAKDWVGRYDLTGRHVVELGCGKGEFLVAMLEAGAGTGVGVDPGLHVERIPEHVQDRFTAVTGKFPQDYPSLADADAVICRHTLEHIAPVGEWLAAVRDAIGDRPGVPVLFELPDVLRVLREGAFWDVYYEHCSYFSAGSLARLFRRTGFEVLDVRTAYEDQYLLIESRTTAPGTAPADALPVEDDLAELAAAVEHYARAEADLVGTWRARIDEVTARGGHAVIWGSGSKGVAFLSALGTRRPAGDDSDLIAYAVDINPHKHDRFMAGSGHRIVAPEHLVADRPDLVIAMNPVYLAEIQADLDRLGVPAALAAL